MTDWGITAAGYEVLEKSGLGKRIDADWGYIRRLVPHGAFVERGEVTEALKTSFRERKKAIKDWTKKSREYYTDPDGFLIVSGKVTDAILRKDELSNLETFGVHSLPDLDSLLGAYVLTKIEDELCAVGRPYTWRSNGYKTQISGSSDSDLQICQHRIKHNLEKNEPSPLFGKLPRSYINADYSYWPILVGTALKCADTIRTIIPEAEDWENTLRKYGWNGDIKTPSSSDMGYIDFPNDYYGKIIAQLPDKTNIRTVKKMFFGIMRPNSNHEVLYVPVINLDNDLVIYTNAKNRAENNDGIDLAPHGKITTFYPSAYFQKEDLSNLFNGTIHGIMTHQSGTPSEFLAHMLWQYDQIRAGKTIDEIWEEGQKFESL